MLARGLLGRLSAHVPKTSTHDLSNATYAALIAQSGLSKQFLSTAHNVLKLYSPALARSYAIAVKTRAAKPRTTTKKAAPRKITKKAPAKKKAPVKSKAKKKVKKVARAPKSRARRPKTEKQKEAADKSKGFQKIRDLRATALKEPKGKPPTVWTLILQEESKGGFNASKNAGVAKERYANLSPAERENLNQIVTQNKADNAVAYRKWVESHTPDQIRLANNARKLLASLSKSGTPNIKPNYKTIRDDRAPKKAVTPHLVFYKERYASGDFKGMPVQEASALALAEYKALPASEKKRYEDRFQQERDQYIVDYKRIYGRDPPAITRASASASASPSP